MGFVYIAILCLKQWVAFTTFVPVKSCVHLSLKKISNVVERTMSSMIWDEAIYRRKVSLLLKCGNVSGDFTRRPLMLKHIREHFPYRRSLTEHQLLERIKKGNIFGYVQCDIEVPKKLRANFANFSPLFKNTFSWQEWYWWLDENVCRRRRNDVSTSEMSISSFTLQNGTLITLLLFYLQLGLVVTKIQRFVEYISKKCFNSIVQSAVDARRQGDENANSTVVAETMKLIANSSYGYQMMDRSRHTVTKYLSDEKTHALLIVNCSKS